MSIVVLWIDHDAVGHDAVNVCAEANYNAEANFNAAAHESYHGFVVQHGTSSSNPLK